MSQSSPNNHAPQVCTIRALFVSAIGALALLPAVASTAGAAPTKLFNAELSLAGTCKTEPVDPVPDPTCSDATPTHPPEGAFLWPKSAAADRAGNIYVVNSDPSPSPEVGSYIDIFDSTGRYLTQVEHFGAMMIAVDSEGHLYVGHRTVGTEIGDKLLRYDPTVYNPEAGEIAYGSPPVLVKEDITIIKGGFVVDLEDDHLLLRAHVSAPGGTAPGVIEYGAPTAGVANSVVAEKEFPVGGDGAIALDSARNRLYLTVNSSDGEVKVFQSEPPYLPLPGIEEAKTPAGKFFSNWRLEVAVDEENGHLYVGDLGAIQSNKNIHEFNPSGKYVGTLAKSDKIAQDTAWMAVDNWPSSPNRGNLYVPSGDFFSTGRLFTYTAVPPAPPEVESLTFSAVTGDEAILRAIVNPHGAATDYRFEYVSEAKFQKEGFASAQLAGEGTIAASGEGQSVSAPVTGLAPATVYRFRIAAENECPEPPCSDEAEAAFTTFESVGQPGGCPNQALRTGPSAALPDCRAYELVTPANTGGLTPLGTPFEAGSPFPSPTASPLGGSLVYRVTGGTVPSLGGTGAAFGDAYRARRGSAGWRNELFGPDGPQAVRQYPGGWSAEHDFHTFRVQKQGSLLIGPNTDYVRHADGSFHLAGDGPLGTDFEIRVPYIAPGGSHTLFLADEPIHPDAVAGASIYDRTGDGALHVVSLLPSGEAAGGVLQSGAGFEGTSKDGSAVAFRAGSAASFYLRSDNSETFDPTFQVRSGQEAICSVGGLEGGVPAYEWLLDGDPIPGATEPAYTPEAGQAGSILQCAAAAANSEGGYRAAGPPLVIDENAEGGPPPRPMGGVGALPSAPAVGEVLQCESGTWSAGSSFTYQWYRDGEPIAGATSQSHEAQGADERTQLQCSVRAQAAGTSAVAFSGVSEPAAPQPPRQTTEPSVSNETEPGTAPVAGDELLCAEGKWEGVPNFTFQWLRDGSPIAAATAATYSVAAEDEGTVLQCRVRAENAESVALSVTRGLAVEPLESAEAPLGGASVSGIFAVGETLECKPTIANEPTLSYQWLRDGEPIAAATEATYALTAEDRETTVQCAVTGTTEKGAVLALSGRFVNKKPALTVGTPAMQSSFAGLSADGRYLFYMLSGDLYRFDTEEERTLQITAAGDITPANVAPGGTAAYYLSDSALAVGPNPNGAEPVAGEPNLYHWGSAGTRFVGTVTDADVKGIDVPGGSSFIQLEGLGEWLDAAPVNDLAQISSRTTPEGEVLVFRSAAELSGAPTGGEAQIYRYASSEGLLACLSCNPTGETPSSSARLNSFTPEGGPHRQNGQVSNLSPDGRRAFFETVERLVVADADGVRDVYQWEAQGKGSCDRPGGCVSLISSGQSSRPNYIFGVSESGNDVFILTADRLLAEDPDETPSVYDARVNGGFPPKAAGRGECLGDACQPAAEAPNDPTPTSLGFQGNGNVVPKSEQPNRRCQKGKRKAGRRGGKAHRGGKTHRGGKARGSKARRGKPGRGKGRCARTRKKRHAKHDRRKQGGAKRRAQR